MSVATLSHCISVILVMEMGFNPRFEKKKAIPASPSLFTLHSGIHSVMSDLNWEKGQTDWIPAK